LAGYQASCDLRGSHVGRARHGDNAFEIVRILVVGIFAGSRMLQGLLVAEGCKIGRRHVKTLMKRMQIEALYRRSRTTKQEPGHKVHP
jgi:hypothetical protein